MLQFSSNHQYWINAYLFYIGQTEEILSKIDSMGSKGLRDILRAHVVALHHRCTHASIPDICEKLGLPIPEVIGTKQEKMNESFNALADEDIPHVAERFLEIYQLGSEDRNQLQDALWSETENIEIPKKFRREVARALSGVDIYLDHNGFDNLLDKLWVLDDNIFAIFGLGGHTLRQDIEQHVYRNPEDWSVEHLFDRLGAFDTSDKRFALFLEGLASSDVRPDEDDQRRFVQIVNDQLIKCGVELHEIDIDGGYPVFRIISNRVRLRGRPKNLIFASQEKPDLRFIDAVNNDIEIVTNAEKVLVYDRPIGTSGLRWKDLQAWWRDTNEIVDDEVAKRNFIIGYVSASQIALHHRDYSSKHIIKVTGVQ